MSRSQPNIAPAPTGTATPATALPSLRDLGASRGIQVGTAFNGNKNAKYRALLKHHSGLIVPEWQLKPNFLRPSRKAAYYFAPSDSLARFAAANGMNFHGHTLFWHEEPLRWANSRDYDAVKRDYGGFIRDVVAHYPQAVSWDVFNEIIGEDAPTRNEYLIREHGIQFVDFCLRTTHEMAPSARLALNEYNLECAEDWCRTKQRNMLDMLGKLRKMGSPVHAVGIQGHLSTIYRASPRATLDMIDRLSDLGLDVFISELDVNDSTIKGTIKERDKQVADYYEEFLGAVLTRSAVKRLVFWGISDFDNWVVRGQTQERRKTGKPRPALFDSNNDPKPAFHAVVRALEGAKTRPSEMVVASRS